MNDLISRQAAIDALTHKWDGMVTSVFDVINSLPSAQPDLDEWCTDCKEYDKERNSCPRWNRVIKETLKDLQEERKTQLSEENTTSDCISRQAAIRWVKTECNPYGKPTLDYDSGKKVIEHLEAMPSAQPERKTGRWISVFDEDEDKCSECQAAFFCASTRFDFCPNCGADMRGKQP